MVPLNQLNADTILSDEILTEIFGQEDEIYKSRLILSLIDKANDLGVKKKFEELIKAYKRVEREIQRRRKEEEKQNKPKTLVNNWTNFEGPYDNMLCKEWIASDNGICLMNYNTGFTDILACYHPILPVERLKNMETGEEQIKLAYKRNGMWSEIIVPKTMITSANKIVALSGRGISVTSENARYLVRYLSDVENANDEYINVQYSSSKLGWIKGGFLPYDTDIVFDGDSRFRQLFESVGEHGDRDIWLEHIRAIRSSGRIEAKFMLAASLASVIIGMVGGLPFIVDLWGETEGGKTVAMMVAASVWANPDESRFIGDFKTTDVALEAKADMLNNLPMMLDDTSKKNRRIEENFEGVVYDLCSGKGKSRSNRDLGINRENRWRNCILTNGERPLSSYVTQGGAINRILEIECGENVFENPQETSNLVKQNHGFAGKEFVGILKKLGVDEVRRIQNDFQKQLFDDEKMQKQSISLSIILTADKIATEHIFKDGQSISLEEAKQVLIDRNELSDNERCYQYILSDIAINSAKFDPGSPTAEKWGAIEGGYAIIYNNVFDAICRKGGFSRKSFLSWAGRKGIIQTQGSRMSKVKRFEGSVKRCIFLKLDDETDEEEEFVEIDESQNELPFK
ncbi:DUF927 domain-containing protein [Candidatus Saccharibacteria bacterium]|nr:DUF927 domain-containing protein [Candidatus Saccharibacteria bacterium]